MDVEASAVDWALRHPLSPRDEREIEQWLAHDTRHAGALLRAMAGLSVVEAALEGSIPVEHFGLARQLPETSRRRVMAGLGGAIAAVVTGLFVWPRITGERMTTAQGEIRRVPLADGSVAMIDADTDLSVTLAQDGRHIALTRGRAWFQVAKDQQRPFVVDAGVAQARAVGTAFSVRRTDHGVEVAVTEGVVAAWASDARGEMTILHAGEYATFTSATTAGVTGTAPAAIERSLAWRDGEIALEGDTLASAVTQFNRYNSRKLVVADARLAKEPLVGLFQIGSPELFAATVAATLDVKIVTTSTEIRIVRKNASEVTEMPPPGL